MVAFIDMYFSTMQSKGSSHRGLFDNIAEGSDNIFNQCSDFRQLIRGQFVDKTHFIPLLLRYNRMVFLRPRRFGKSVTISMLQYFFYGAVDLFRGLAVFESRIAFQSFNCSRDIIWNPSNSSDHYFPPIPVIRLDFSQILGDVELTKESSINEAFCQGINDVFVANGLDPQNDYKSAAGLLQKLIRELSYHPLNAWGRVVILIDEYDYAMNRCSTAEQFNVTSNVIASIFRVLKTNDDWLQFAYVTGITSYGLAGLYSGANNFDDKSFEPLLHDLCGLTTNEVKKCLKVADIPWSDDLEKSLRRKYDGYCWHVKESTMSTGNRLFNTYAISRYVGSRDLQNYWIETSSKNIFEQFPSIFNLPLPMKVPARLLKERKPTFHGKYQSDEHDAFILFEAGYATIVNVTEVSADSDDIVTLDHVNEAMSDALLVLATQFIDDKLELKSEICDAAAVWKRQGDIEPFLKAANKIHRQLVSTNYRAYDSEARWGETLRFVLLIGGVDFECEQGSALGYSDFVIVNKFGDMRILELKLVKERESNAKEVSRRDLHMTDLEDAAHSAICQIISRRYFDVKYVQERLKNTRSLKIVGVAISECSIARQISHFQELDIDTSSLTSGDMTWTDKATSKKWLLNIASTKIK